jgi:hypothetical protein
VTAARKRGKKLALDAFQDREGEAFEFTVEDAKTVLDNDGAFKDRSVKCQAAMVYELHDAAVRFHEELSGL